VSGGSESALGDGDMAATAGGYAQAGFNLRCVFKHVFFRVKNIFIYYF
jgi:hypothetical protein